MRWGGRDDCGGVGGSEGLADVALGDDAVDVPEHPGPEVELAGGLHGLGDPGVCRV